MAKFRKKTFNVDAFKWTGGPDQSEDPIWLADAMEKGLCIFKPDGTGGMIVGPDGMPIPFQSGHYIIKSSEGDIYALSSEFFEMNYEPAEA